MFLAVITFVNETTGEESWPALPKGKLEFKQLGDKYADSIKTETIEISRSGNRIARLTKIDRNADGKFEEFMFSASVARKPVFTLSRMRGTNEFSQFVSHDDTMVMNNMEFPEKNFVALVIASKKHKYCETFTRHPDGYYWPADESQRNVVDAFFKASAETGSILRDSTK